MFKRKSYAKKQDGHIQDNLYYQL